jgi:uncharacterized sulfatase
VGQVVDEIRSNGLEQDTLVFFSSDNGPVGASDGGGSTGGFRGRKGTVWEGGVRVPGIFYWPGRIPARITNQPASMVDILPTVAALGGATLPSDRVYDGVDIGSLLTGQTDQLAERDLFFWINKNPIAVRRGTLKYSRAWSEAGGLFDLAADPFESEDLSAARPDVAAALEAALSAAELE